MAGNRSIARHLELKAALGHLRARGQALVDLTRDADYPTQFWAVGPDDEYPKALLSWGLSGEWGDWIATDDDEVTIVLKSRPSARPKWIVARLEGVTWEIAEPYRTREATSVLGRPGSVGIVCEQLTKALAGTGLWTGAKVRRRDLARLAAAAGSTEPAEERTRAHEKVLARIDQGGFVMMELVNAVARPLGIRVQELCFVHPAIYEKAAWNRRRQDDAQRRKVATVDLLNARKAFEVRLEALDPLKTGLIGTLERAAAQGLVRYERRVTGRPATRQETWSRELAIATFVAKVANRETLGVAVLALQNAGVAAWFGQYQDRVPINPLDPERAYRVAITGRAVARAVLVFTEADAQPPTFSVDLSHTVDLSTHEDAPE